MESVREDNRCTQQSFLISTAYNYFVVEIDYRERLRINRNNILPKADVVINLVTSEPRSLGQIKNALIVHGHTDGDSIRKLKPLLDRLEVVRFPFPPWQRRGSGGEGWLS